MDRFVFLRSTQRLLQQRWELGTYLLNLICFYIPYDTLLSPFLLLSDSIARGSDMKEAFLPHIMNISGSLMSEALPYLSLDSNAWCIPVDRDLFEMKSVSKHQ
ncbi:hypothetical protein CPB86DRAFT_590213 [Serendipita vermifera]|nr:hypothetical protein CPB86DRAFT_590213 [Serendipita vermifera]